ncbi:RNA polymerase sigma-28 factor precursor [compost metagenome]
MKFSSQKGILRKTYVNNQLYSLVISVGISRRYDPRIEAEFTESNIICVLFRILPHIVKKFDNTGEDMEDLISIGTIGLIKAIESYRPNKGTKLATFAARCIENEILMHLRSLKKTRKDVSLHDPIGTDKEGNEITLIDILGSEADDVIKEVDLKIEKSKIYRNLDILDEREKEVVVGRFGLDTGGEERTQWEIAKDLGISRSYVSRIEKRALMKLYHEFYKAKR